MGRKWLYTNCPEQRKHVWNSYCGDVSCLTTYSCWKLFKILKSINMQNTIYFQFRKQKPCKISSSTSKLLLKTYMCVTFHLNADASWQHTGYWIILQCVSCKKRLDSILFQVYASSSEEYQSYLCLLIFRSTNDVALFTFSINRA